MRILYIDDDPLWLGLLKEMLREAVGDTVKVATALTGSQGLRLAGRYPFDLIISDLNLCDMSGVDLVADLRAAHPDTPIAALTGSHDLSILAKSRSAGANHFLSKPVSLTSLNNMLDKIPAAREAVGRAATA
jgi:DNA-binding response OmpR family regulator